MKRSISKLLKEKPEYLCIVAIIIVSIFQVLLSIGKQLNEGILLTNTLDFSWVTDIIERLLHGYIAGKDFIFTYGPLYQVIESLPSLMFGMPSYQSYLYASVFLTVIVGLVVFFITKLLIRDKKEQIFFLLYLYFIVGLFMYPDPSTLFRMTSPLLYSLLYYRYALTSKKYTRYTLLTLSLPAILGLYTFDLFLLCFLLSIVLFFYDFFSNDKKTSLRKNLTRLGLHILTIIAFELLVSLVLTNNFDYFVYSLDMARNYQFLENIPISKDPNLILLIFPLSLPLVLFYFLKFIPDKNLKKACMVLTFAALLQLKSTLIRTDEAHIVLGVYPNIIVIFILLYFVLRHKGMRLLPVILFVVLYTLIPYKQSLDPKTSMKNFYTAINAVTHPKSFFSLYTFLPNYYYTQKDFMYLESLIKKNPNNVFIYPTDTFILNIYGQTYNTYPVLFHNASGSLGEKHAVAKLSQSPPKYIILGIDKVSAVTLDDIPNFSRNPYLAKWMLEHYSLYQNRGKYLVLHYDPNKAKQTERKTKTTCDIYELSTNTILRSNLLENLSKPSTYYYQKLGISSPNLFFRLPYSGNDMSILIIEEYSNPLKISELFQKRINMNNFSNQTKNDVTIIKKYPIPYITQTFISPFSAKCY